MRDNLFPFQYLVCRSELFRLTQSVCVTYDIASHTGVLRGSSCVSAPRRTSAWEATYDRDRLHSVLI